MTWQEQTEGWTFHLFKCEFGYYGHATFEQHWRGRVTRHVEIRAGFKPEVKLGLIERHKFQCEKHGADCVGLVEALQQSTRFS